MLPILRSRPSQVLVALLCALVLSRIPAPVYAEDAIPSLVKIEESAAIAALIAPTLGMAVGDSVLAVSTQVPTRPDPPNHPSIEHPILRL